MRSFVALFFFFFSKDFNIYIYIYIFVWINSIVKMGEKGFEP